MNCESNNFSFTVHVCATATVIRHVCHTGCRRTGSFSQIIIIVINCRIIIEHGSTHFLTNQWDFIDSEWRPIFVCIDFYLVSVWWFCHFIILYQLIFQSCTISINSVLTSKTWPENIITPSFNWFRNRVTNACNNGIDNRIRSSSGFAIRIILRHNIYYKLRYTYSHINQSMIQIHLMIAWAWPS